MHTYPKYKITSRFGQRYLGCRLVMAGILMALSGTAVAAPSSESQLNVATAKRNIQKGDTSSAIIELKNAVRADPTNSDARYELAALYMLLGNPESALPELESARSRGYDEAKILPLLAQCYIALGRYRDVLTKVPVANLKGEARATVLAAQARANLAVDDLPTARQRVSEALAEGETFAPALTASARLHMAEGKFAEAEADVEKARASGDSVELLMLKGELRQKQNDPVEAGKYFDQAVTKFPNHISARLQRAAANVVRNQLSMVPADVEWVLARHPRQPMGLFLKAYLLANEKKYRESTEILLSLPDLVERYTPAMYLLGESALQDGKHETAHKYAERYVQNLPDDIAGIKLLARVNHRMGRTDQTIAALEPLLKRFPEDNQLKIQLAGALLEVGRSEEAVALFQQGLARDPNNADAQLSLAVGQLQAGRGDEAVAQMERTIQANPSSLQANSLLILTELQLKHNEKALRAANAMVKANSADPNAHNLLGTVYLASNNFNAARAAFRAALANDAKFLPAILNLARVEERSGNRSEAKQWYQKAIATDSTNLTGYQGLANLAVREDKLDEAVDYLKQAVRRDSSGVHARVRLVNFLLERKRNSQALLEAHDLANTSPKAPEALDALARAQIANGELENGLGSYKRLAAQNPDNPEAHRRLGLALQVAAGKDTNSKYFADAAIAFEQAVKIAPDDVKVLADRIDLERRAKGVDAAVALAQSYARARPESVPRMIVYGDTQLLARQPTASATYRQVWEKTKTSLTTTRLYAGLAQEGKDDEALKIIKDWIASHPSDYDARFLLANHYIRTGKTREAIAENEAISAAFPENPALLNNLAWLYAKEDSAKAIELAERAYVLAPQSPDVLDTLGWLRVSSSTDAARGEALLRTAHEIAPERGDIGFHYATALSKNNKSSDAKAVLAKTLAGDRKFTERAEAQALFNKLSLVK